MRCVAYIRVSTREQDEQVQLGAIREFASKHGITLLDIYNWIKGRAGRSRSRSVHSARRLVEDITRLKPDCVLAWALDRLGRSMLDTVNTVVELENQGVRVITVKEEFLRSLDPNIRRLILSILAWVAEYERRRIRERQLEAWAQGKQKGRPPKVSDDTIVYYLRKYSMLSKKAVWKIMRADGYDISYDRFLKRVKNLQNSLSFSLK